MSQKVFTSPGVDDRRQDPLVPDRPSFLIAMGIGALIILIFTALVIAAILIPVPDTIHCSFVLVPQGGADPVRAPISGTLDSVETSETSKVRKGQLLFAVRSNEMQVLQTELRTLEQEVSVFDQRLALLAKNYATGVEILKAKVEQSEKELAYEKDYSKTYENFLERIVKLGEEGLVSRVDLLSHQLAAAKANRDVALTERNYEMAVLEWRRADTEYEKQVASEQNEKQKILLKMAGLRRQLQGSLGDRAQVAAPFDGTVLSLGRRTSGEVVSSGQELCRIARSDAPLRAELSVPEEGLPRLQIGQQVRLFCQAFPYQRFGTAVGTLSWVSPGVMTSGQEERFVAWVELTTRVMKVGDQNRLLQAGMSGEARVVVGKRTLIDYAFDPIRQLRENWSQ